MQRRLAVLLFRRGGGTGCVLERDSPFGGRGGLVDPFREFRESNAFKKFTTPNLCMTLILLHVNAQRAGAYFRIFECEGSNAKKVYYC